MAEVQFPYKKIVDSALKTVPQKARDVLIRRFGLRKEPETLQAIGSSYGITRERVRQIEDFGLKILRHDKDVTATLAPVAGHFNAHLEECGKLKKEETLLQELGGKAFQPHVRFILTVAEPFARHSDADDFYALWHVDKTAVDFAKKVIEHVVARFKKEGRPLSESELAHWCESELPGICGNPVATRAFFSYIGVSKLIQKNPFGEYGLREFPEIRPRGVRDEAYIVLAKEKRPLHFMDIAKRVGKLRQDYHLRAKIANPQTVHNELIKDARFVLVGRGMYALADWGYTPGIVREVIAAVLKEVKEPLSREKIITEVKKKRFVKDNTILLNLHNKKYFRRTPEGLFALRA